MAEKKTMIIAIAVRPDVERNDTIDALAKDTAQDLSATPIEEFQFALRETVGEYDRLMYSAIGTPKEE